MTYLYPHLLLANAEDKICVNNEESEISDVSVCSRISFLTCAKLLRFDNCVLSISLLYIYGNRYVPNMYLKNILKDD